jgi:hypothetical protein
MHTYAGIGSRDTPPGILHLMEEVAFYKAMDGWFLNSGGAKGADSAFERGVLRANYYADIYCFKDYTPAPRVLHFNSESFPNFEQALELASSFHPAWDRCSDYAKKLHARNAYIILSNSLENPVDVVYCWTPGGGIVGGTGQALRMARHYEIEVFNFANLKDRIALEKYIEERKH